MELKQFKLGMQELTEAFMKHKDGEEYDVVGNWGGYWIGGDHTDYGTFSDGSDYYHWSTSDMYSILTNDISYDIAIEHQDWSIDWDGETPNGWVKLTVYAMLRKGNMEMSTKDFQRKLERDYYLGRAYRLTDNEVAKDEEYIKKAREHMEAELSRYTK